MDIVLGWVTQISVAAVTVEVIMVFEILPRSRYITESQ